MASVISGGFRALPLPVVQLSLAAVLKCGQSFRWSSYPLPPSTGTLPNEVVDNAAEAFARHEYRLCLHDRVICLRQSPSTLFYRAVFPHDSASTGEQALRDASTLEWLRDYFQLDVDLVSLYDEWSAKDRIFSSFRSRFEGIRMLRQDPWENLISFICSSNNNISRISKMIMSLCQHYSAPLLSLPDPSSTPTMHTYHPFPPPSVLAKPEVSSVLRSLGFGYRADFIQRTAGMLVGEHGLPKSFASGKEPAELWLRTLRKMPTADAREELLKLMGVGRKVADCVLLMSLDKREVIPVDTHVYQIAIKHYGLRGSTNAKQTINPRLYDEVNKKLSSKWGDYAGWAHSVLFTADLKSFSSYGLPSPGLPSPSTKLDTANPRAKVPPSPLLTPSPSPLKRKRTVILDAVSSRTSTFEREVLLDMAIKSEIQTEDGLSMAERIKKRTRRSVVR